MAAAPDIPEIGLHTDQMYREDVFSDLKVGSVRRFTPVSADGEPDPDRAVIYHGQTTLNTPGGQLPMSFDLQADTLAGAIDAFPKAAQAEGQRVIEEMQELQRQQAAGGPGGNGGRIQMP